MAASQVEEGRGGGKEDRKVVVGEREGMAVRASGEVRLCCVYCMQMSYSTISYRLPSRPIRLTIRALSRGPFSTTLYIFILPVSKY